ncbi:MAG: EamA family transporter [Cryobacterium sp.]|nr:EamA family transporter [Cryobacterium sp.]
MRHVLFILLAAVCFGTTGTAAALGPDAGALSVGAARIVIGGGALAAIAWLLARRRRAAVRAVPVPMLAPESSMHRVPTWLVIALGAAGVVAYQPSFFAGTAANGVAVGTVVALGSAPVLTGVLDWMLYRRFPGTWWLVATVIATAGVVLLGLASAGEGALVSADPLGLLASVGAGLGYAVYALAGKELIGRGWDSTSSMGALFGWSAVASIPILLLTDYGWLATVDGMIMALWLGLVTTTLGYVLFGLGLTALRASTVTTLTLAEPLTASTLGFVVLGERLAPLGLLGVGVLALGIVVLTIGSTRSLARLNR